jgi:hypothetical protein
LRSSNELGLERAFTAVIRRVADDVEDGLLRDRDAGDVVRLDRRAHDALVESVEIDAIVDLRRRFRLVLVLVLVLVLFLALVGILLAGIAFLLARGGAVVARRERVLDVLAQREREDAGVAVRGKIPLDARQLRRPLAVAEVIQILAVGRERRAVGIETRLTQMHVLAGGHIAHVELGLQRVLVGDGIR